MPVGPPSRDAAATPSLRHWPGKSEAEVKAETCRCHEAEAGLTPKNCEAKAKAKAKDVA